MTDPDWTDDHAGPRRLIRRRASFGEARYSICTMVTRWGQYDACAASFRDHGFDQTDCEYLVIDNGNGNSADAYIAINEFLQTATGRYIVLVHQDVLLLDDGRKELDGVLDDLTRIDGDWGLCGNSGRSADGWPAIRISDPHGENTSLGSPFPTPVVALDENFIVVRREANLAASANLRGFHHYGADLCVIADILGWRAYVVNFHLRHLSDGAIEETYERSHREIAAKYAAAFRPRWIHLSTRRSFFVAGRRAEAVAARVLRFAGKVIGVVPRHHHLNDESRRKRRVERP